MYIGGYEVSIQHSISDLIKAREDILKRTKEMQRISDEISKLNSTYFGGVISHHKNELFSCDEEIRKYYSHLSWQILIKGCKLTNAMSETGKTKFLDRIEKNTPLFNETNILGFMQNAEKMYNDGFKGLLDDVWNKFHCCRYRSANGDSYWWKEDNVKRIKKRFITSTGFSYDSWSGHRLSYHSHSSNQWEDLYNLCHILDKKPKPAYDKTFSRLCDEQLKNNGQFVVCDYFTVKCHKNGNSHVTWSEDKLHILGLINQYGSNGQLPDIHEKKYKKEHFENGPRHSVHKPKNEKEEGFFETPKIICEKLIDLSNVSNGDFVLEPSAGKGAIASYFPPSKCHCIEFNSDRRNFLINNNFTVLPNVSDFLSIDPYDYSNQYDVIIANPPFSNKQDIDHVNLMLDIAKRKVVSVMSAGTLFRADSKTIQFRNRVEKLGGTFHKLPAGSFKDSGTNVNAVILEIDL